MLSSQLLLKRRPPQSIHERSEKNGLSTKGWSVQLLWQFSFLHADVLQFEFSTKQMRNIYEFVKTVLINKYWYLFNLNICSDDFSLGRARSILLEGLFVGLYDLKTLESRLDLLERQPYTVVYQTFLRNKLLKSASLIRFHQGGFRRTATQRLQELKHESFDFLDPTDRVKMEHDVLVTAFYGGSRGKTVAQRLQELKHESFDFLDPKDRVKMEEDAVNTALILSATRREGLHIGAQSTSVSSDTVAASIVKKFKSTHSVVVNTELEVMEAQLRSEDVFEASQSGALSLGKSPGSLTLGRERTFISGRGWQGLIVTPTGKRVSAQIPSTLGVIGGIRREASS